MRAHKVEGGWIRKQDKDTATRTPRTRNEIKILKTYRMGGLWRRALDLRVAFEEDERARSQRRLLSFELCISTHTSHVNYRKLSPPPTAGIRGRTTFCGGIEESGQKRTTRLRKSGDASLQPQEIPFGEGGQTCTRQGNHFPFMFMLKNANPQASSVRN